MAEKTIVLSGPADQIERAIRELQSTIDYDRIPVTVQVKKEKRK